MNKKKLNNNGFSLVELIIVIAIMAVLVGVLAPQYLGYVEKTKQSTDVQNAQQLASEIAVRLADKESGDLSAAVELNDDGAYHEVAVAVSASSKGQVSAVPAVKNTKAGSKFYYMIDSQDTVHIAVTGATAPTNDVTDLYPKMGTTSVTNYDKIKQ